MTQIFGATLEEREALLADARRIAPAIGAAADEIEAARQLPKHVVNLLRSVGAFRLIQPRWLGGHAADPVTQILFIAEIAKADASAGWCVMIGCDSGFVSRGVDRDLAMRMFADRDAASCGGAFPPGAARRVEAGYVANGRWPYMSGITHSTWAQFACRLVDDGGAPVSPAQILRFVVPVGDLIVHDTWHTSGMCGTGSHDAEAVELFIPEERVLPERDLGRSGHDDPLSHLSWLLPKHMGVPLGLTQGAYEEVLAIAQGRVAMRGALRDDPLMQSTLGETAARIASCRAYALSAADDAWRECCDTGELSEVTRARLRLAITHVHQESARVMEQLYSVAGSAALYTARSTLGRRLRDMQAMNQHVVLGASTYAAAARVLLGLKPSAPFW
ncbi:MAG: acyl-CoA dehydrogenase family protein [Chloroflexi bacterium]|nr:acyl-CoA dehydrogenase family protein [Chloroflexota bacterium]MCY3695656.1 acyl-CoA dehydrogenase family protein [Chloroflexota bacterium]